MVIPREYKVGQLTLDDLARIEAAATEAGLTVIGDMEIEGDPRGTANTFQHPDKTKPDYLAIFADGSVRGDIEKTSTLGQILGRLESEHPAE